MARSDAEAVEIAGGVFPRPLSGHDVDTVKKSRDWSVKTLERLGSYRLSFLGVRADDFAASRAPPSQSRGVLCFEDGGSLI